jgi:hypothetical protein
VTRNRAARLYPNGALDTDFNPNANNSVDGAVIQGDGGIVLTGKFTGIGGSPRNYVARLVNDAATQSLFSRAAPASNGFGGVSPEALQVTFDLSTVAPERKQLERFLEFFAANIRNENTREAYFRAACRFCEWADARPLSLESIRPPHVAAYIEILTKQLSDPTVKQHLAAIRMLFNFLVIGQVVPINPAAAVRGTGGNH